MRHYFTFGQTHMTNFHLPAAGRLADFWVAVDLPEGHPVSHREVFIRHFADHHLPRPQQWAFEYDENSLKPEFFPGGELCLITQNGVQNETR
jgi:hypothetical protein